MEGVEIALIMESGTSGSNVHPHEKEIVGLRLAAIARAKEYGENITYGGPTYKSHTISGNKIVLKFDHVGAGLTDNDGGALQNFLIAGKDRNFVAATATIVGDTVEVTAAGVSNPVAVRHAWHMNINVDFFNADGFSSSSFRTDKWIVAPGRPLRVACIGDSITFGYGIADPADYYPAQLGQILGTQNFEVRNYGISGYGIYRSSKRYDTTTEYTTALAWNPDIVICNLGINDITDWGTYTQEQFETEYFQLVDAFATSGADPLFIQWNPLAPLYPGQTFYGDPNVVILNDWIREAAANTNAMFLDMETPLLGHPEWFPDNIHPNAIGAREIAETTFCLLDSIGDMDGVGSISEFMSINTSGLQDEDGDFSDWIELSNTGTGGLCLNEHFLTNTMDNLMLWKIPTSTVIDPGKSLIVFASSKDRAINQAKLHTNFTLADTGGDLALVARDGTTILDSHINFPAQHANVSYGKTTANTIESLGSGATLAVYVPVDDSLGTTWTGVGFDDASWTAGASGVGYDDATATTFTGAQIWNTSFQNGWTEINGAGTTETLNGTILTYDHTGSGTATTLDGTSSSMNGIAWSGINSGDWTFEANLKITAAPNGFKLWLCTGTHRIIVNIFNGNTQDDGGNTFNVSHTNNDGQFHVFRVSHDSTDGKYQVWRDDVLLTPAGGVVYDSTASDARLLMGDSTSASSGNDYNVDIASVSYSTTIYTPFIQTNVQSAMMGVNASTYIRLPFTVSGSVSDFDTLTLDIQYDDGFIAYLNGVEVARRNAPASPTWNSIASSDRADTLALASESIDLSPHLGTLVSGANVLALHALNSGVSATRFVVKPELRMSGSSDVRFFQSPTPDSSNGGADTGTDAYTTWKSVHSIAADDTDDDNDGLSAQMEFFTGSDPNSSNSGFRPSSFLAQDGGDDYLGIRFRLANGLSGLSYLLETSDDLVTVPWVPEENAVFLSSADNADGTSTLIYRLPTLMSSISRQFLRVRYVYFE